MEAVQAFRKNALNPDAPVTRGTAENPDVYFQHREASNKFYLNVPDVVEHYMNESTNWLVLTTNCSTT